MYNLAENRQYPRMAIDCGITYKRLDAPEERRAVAKNISCSGMLFIAEEEPELGALMEVVVGPGTVSLPALKAVVEIVRVSPGSSADWGGDGSSGFEIAARIKTVK